MSRDVRLSDAASPGLFGRCHCAALTVEYAPGHLPSDLQPRVCDCSFCTRHGAAYVSDPSGRLAFREHLPAALMEYRQGSGTARFLLCAHCGVLVGAVFEHEARLYGAVNARCLDDADPLASSVPVSPQQLRPDEKAQRWLGVWVPDAIVRRCPPD